jgi:hypothetical protein
LPINILLLKCQVASEIIDFPKQANTSTNPANTTTLEVSPSEDIDASKNLCHKIPLHTNQYEGGNPRKDAAHSKITFKIYLVRRLATARFEAGFAVLRLGEGFVFLAVDSDFDAALLCLKILNGRYAETIQFGASTISLIFKSTAAPHRQ